MPDLSTVVNMFFGADNNKVLYALIILVTLDYITGVCVAIKDKKLSSSIGAKGIINKVVIFIMVSLSHVVDSYLLSSGVALERITIMVEFKASPLEKDLITTDRRELRELLERKRQEQADSA